MVTWTEDRLSDYYAFLGEWPETVVAGSLSADCIKDPDMKATPMERTSFNFTISAKFSTLKTEFDRLGLNMTEQNKRPRFTNHGFEWQIYRVGDDSPVDPIVDFWAGRKQ